MFACLTICREYKNLNLAIIYQTKIKSHDRISLIVRHFYILKNHSIKNRNYLWRANIFLDKIEEEIKLTDFKSGLFNPLF